MANVNTQFMLVGKLFILMGFGYVLKKKNIITNEWIPVLTDLILYVVLPCNILASFLTELTLKRLTQTVEMFFLSVGIQFVSYLLGHFVYRMCQENHRVVLQYGTICSNAGILGIAIAEELFGAEGTFLSAVFSIPQRLVMWTLGLSLFTIKKEKRSLRKIFTHPCIVAVTVGFTFMVLQIQVPELIVNSLNTLGGCTMALSMILAGSVSADMDFRALFHRDILFFTIIRLVLLPMFVLLTCRGIGVDIIVCNVATILSAMPAGVTTVVLALKYDGNVKFATACVALTNFLSLLALPLWCTLL